MGVVRRFAVAGLDEAARRAGRRRGLAVGAIDETGQVKAGTRTAGVKRQYLGCVGKVANGINTVHLAYVREGTGHALIGARQWIPAEHIGDPVKSAVMGLPLDLVFRTKGQLAIDIFTEAFADGVRLDFVCGDEVYGACTELREFLRRPRPGLRAAGPVQLPPHPGRRGHADLQAGRRRLLAGRRALGDPLRRDRAPRANAGTPGPGWPPPRPRHHLLIRRHLTTGELAFHYCYLPEGQPLTMARLIRAAGLRWPVEEDFEFGKDCFGLDQSQVRLYTAIARHTVLVMAALAICAVTAALLRHRTDTQAPPPARPTSRRPPTPA